MLAAVLSLSDDEMILVGFGIAVLGFFLICSGLISMLKSKESNQSPPPRETPVTESRSNPQSNLPTWKRIEMENAEKKTSNSNSTKCLFCGTEMTNDQTFCGKCGRRKD